MLDGDVASLPAFWRDAIRAGWAQAVGEHERLGGAPHGTTVTELAYNYVDTTVAAIECAAAAAAWQSFGHAPETVSFVFADGRWRVRFA